MTTQSVTIPDWLPPPVANQSRQRHWAVVRKEVKAVQTMVWASAKHAGWRYVGDDAPKQRLTINLVFPIKRRRDQDNLFSRVKHVVDGLKPFLIDDDMDHLELIVTAEVRAGVKQTEMVLEPLNNQLEGDHK